MSASFKFIHCADLHLGSSFSGLSSSDAELGKRMKDSLFEALDAIVSKSKEEKVDFVIFSGDIFDSSNETPLIRTRFADALKEIRVPCFISFGNHDFKRRWERSIPFPKNAFVFPENVVKIKFMKNKKAAAIISGASFSTQHTSEDLTADASGSPDVFCIGIFHCNLDASKEDDLYAPCQLSSLLSKDVDYWALGHIHKREIVHENPHVVYPGNTQGRNPKESGEKGAYVVTVKDDVVTEMKFFRTGPILWQDVTLDIGGADDIEQALTQLDDVEKGSMIRLTVTGSGSLDIMVRLDPDGFTELVESRTDSKVTAMEILSKPKIDLDARKDTGDFVSAVINYGNRLETSSREDLLDMICCTNTARSQRDRFERFSDEELRQIVRDATYMIVEKMTEAGE